MIYFGKYLKDYLEYSNISQTEFAMRMGITQKHMNEILNGKTNITLEMAANIERLTAIKSSFIISVENSRILKENILKEYGDLQHIKEEIIKKYYKLKLQIYYFNYIFSILKNCNKLKIWLIKMSKKLVKYKNIW